MLMRPRKVTMIAKTSIVLLAVIVGSVSSFHVLPKTPIARRHFSRVYAEGQVIDTTYTTSSAKERLLDAAERLRDQYGVFVIDKNGKDELVEAVKELEETAMPFSEDSYKQQFLGNWTLVCTTATSEALRGVDTSRLPFFNEGPIKSIRDSLNKALVVKQKIRSMGESNDIDRIDHVLEYMPPDSLKELVDNLPEALTNLNINPLQVSQSTVTLIHKAKIESVSPLKTKLGLESIVLKVAGKSQFLDPSGADVLGVNLPLGEFLNTGSFETTYMDDDVRISRGKAGGGPVEQLRVFVRTMDAEIEDKTTTEAEAAAEDESEQLKTSLEDFLKSDDPSES